MNSTELYKYQSIYLEILNEFFLDVIGKEVSLFGSFDEVHQEILRNLSNLKSGMNAFADLKFRLTPLYAESGLDAYRFAKELNACKLVLGGSSKFYGTQLNATKRALLFSDTVLIPDPILPYLEKDRSDERFFYIGIIQAAFYILQMKELNDEKFDVLPFFVFPSWEKSLEEKDLETQEKMIQLTTDVFTHYVDSGIQSFKDIYEFSVSHEQVFFDQIRKNQLFIAPGRKPGEGIQTSMNFYKSEMLKMRSKEWCGEHLKKPDNILIVNAIFERISPQYHLLENVKELRSSPLLCIDSQAHYYKLVTSMNNSFIADLHTRDNRNEGIVKALTSPRMSFLSNIPYDKMVAIRQSNENIQFRKELRGLVNSLSSAKVEDLDLVSGEVCAHIESLVSKHRKEVEYIKSKYQAVYKHNALIGSASLIVAMIPALAPLAGLGLVATGGTYIKSKLAEMDELNNASNSLMGVVSLAKY